MSFRITKEQISELVADGVRENVNLDYKSVGALTNTPYHKEEISKDVSGFANSAGGIIIYGVSENKHVPQDFDGNSSIVAKKEWIEQVINSNIEPRISGINVETITINDEHSVMIVNVPISHTAHQAKDRRYYHRYGSETLPMEDYQVKQTMNRAKEPVLRIDSIQSDPISVPFENTNNLKKLELILKNYGVITARSVMINVYLPSRLRPFTEREWNRNDLALGQIEGCLKCNAISVEKQPIGLHPQQQIRISGRTVRSSLGLHLVFQFAKYNQTISGYYEIFAENMTPKYGRIDFVFSNSFVTITTSEVESIPYIRELG